MVPICYGSVDVSNGPPYQVPIKYRSHPDQLDRRPTESLVKCCNPVLIINISFPAGAGSAELGGFAARRPPGDIQRRLQILEQFGAASHTTRWAGARTPHTGPKPGDCPPGGGARLPPSAPP